MVGTASALFEALCRRHWLLEELREGPASASKLARAGEVSPATARRGLEELREAALVTADEDGSYSLTLTGRVAHDQFRRSTDRWLGTDRAAPWLAELPRSTPVDPAALEAATVHEREEARARYETLAADATAVSGWSLARRPGEVRPLLAREEAELDLVLTPALTRRLVTEWGAGFVDRLGDDAVTVHEREELPPYGLLLATVDGRRHVCLCVREAGELRALVETDRDDAVEWAAGCVADCRADATPIEPP